MLVPVKSIWTSKTFWAGAIQVVVGVLELVDVNVLASDGAGWVAVFSGGLMILLRAITKQPVALSGGGVKHVEDRAV